MSYSRLIGWLLQNSFRGRSKKLLIAVFFNVLYLAGQGAAIFTIYWYGREMQGDGLVALGPLEKLISLSQAENSLVGGAFLWDCFHRQRHFYVYLASAGS